MTSVQTAPVSPLEGRWVNQMGSEMALEATREGLLTGRYRAAAGALAGLPCQLVGRTPHGVLPGGHPLAFVVEWPEAGCVTAWCGEYLSEPVEEIRATWLMTSQAASADEWRSTMIGHDVFRRVG